jgi:hypothetical protein
MIEITAVRVAHGGRHEDIADVMWRSEATSAGLSPATAIIEWLSSDAGNHAAVVAGGREVAVEVVRPVGGSAHLRARDGEVWTDDLLALPKF